MPELRKGYGEYIYVYDTITNVGNVPIGNCAVSIWISPTKPPEKGYASSSKEYGRLEPGKSIKVRKGDVAFYIDKNIPTGRYYVYLVVRDLSVSPPWGETFDTGYTVNILVPERKVEVSGVVVE